MSPIQHIIPQPVEVTAGHAAFHMDDDTPLLLGDGCDHAGRFAAAILRLAPAPAAAAPAPAAAAPAVTLRLEVGTAPPEGYRLEVSPAGISLAAPDEAGLFHAVQTLRQLLPPAMMAGRTAPAIIPAVTIVDYPRFRWRGMHLDVGRHLFPVSFIKKYVDLLALHKMNVFHWHLTEDQGWRIPIDKYPRLTEIGGWRRESPLLTDRTQGDGVPYGGFYTKDEIREIVAYAGSRGITVVPEIELPGHAVAALAAYPHLGCVGGGYEVRTTWGIAEDVFCAGSDEVFPFLHDVFDEVLDLFPSPYIHIGGDECPKTRWRECEKCQARIKTEGLAGEEGLQSWFIEQIGRYLHQKGRKMIGWDEILEGGLPPGAAVMSWRGTEGGIAAASEGHPVVMSPVTHCYFDYYQTAERDKEPPAFYWPIPEEMRREGGPAFYGLITLEQAYTFDPLAGVPEAYQGHVMGGQGNLWTEYVATAEQAEYQLLPRGAALAETLWSPLPEGGRDFAGFIGRLATHLRRLDALQVNYRFPREQLPG